MSSRLSIRADGSVEAQADGDSVVLFTPSPALGLRLTSLTVTPSGLELHGSLDVGALLR